MRSRYMSGAVVLMTAVLWPRACAQNVADILNGFPHGGPDEGCEHLVIQDCHGDGGGAFVYCRDDMHSPAHLVNGVDVRTSADRGQGRDPNVALEVRSTADGTYGVYVALRPLAAGTILVSECWGPDFGRMSPRTA